MKKRQIAFWLITGLLVGFVGTGLATNDPTYPNPENFTGISSNTVPGSGGTPNVMTEDGGSIPTN